MASKPILVASIDFGTTYSGWACSFLHEFESDATKASVKHWHSGSGTLTTEKTPTVVLVKPDGKTLEAFGYEAENRYKELIDEGEHEDYYYFRRFKMTLHKAHGKNLHRGIMLKDEMGKSLLALDVFAMAIKFLVKDMYETGKDRITGHIKTSEVHWVLTVPAIWTDSAKQFMREAAENAGILSDKLSISLEPEAASLFCRYLSVEKTVNRSDVSIAAFPAKTRYMILDAGGGTIDITVHEVEHSGKVKEIKAASGGGWGGILVDQAFEHLVEEIVGKHIYKNFKEKETEDWLDLWRDFEVKKRTVRPDKDARVVMKFPLSLVKMVEKKNRQAFDEYMASSDYAESITVTGDKLKFQAGMFKRLFDTSVHKTIQHVENLLRDEKVRMIKAILMVGGFSESPMLQEAVRSAFPGIKVVIPIDATSSIMRGALIFGHSPRSITERVLKNTYGFEINQDFEEGVHPEQRRISSDLGDRCSGVFNKHVEKNQIVKVGEAQSEQKYSPIRYDQTKLSFPLYASDLKNPKFIDEGCTYIGKMTVKLTDHDGDLNRYVWVSLTFSGTEIEVQARDEKTGEETTATLNFLG